MDKLRLNIKGSPRELADGLNDLLTARTDRFTASKTALSVSFIKQDAAGDSKRIDIKPIGRTIEVHYNQVSDAFRALGVLMGAIAASKPVQAYSETTPFKRIGFMLDFSRNGVMTVSAIESYLRRAALMGFNQFLPYIEDTYEVPGEPFWGYLRGRYSKREMRAIADIAARYGMEIVPVIQTWGHADQILQWPPYSKIKRGGGDFKTNDEATYALLEKAIRSAADGFRTKTIHIGMDEVGNFGTGDPGEIFISHITRIADICKSMNLDAMAWGDMPYQIYSKDKTQSIWKSEIPKGFIKRLPKNVQFICWDYCQPDPKDMTSIVESVQELGEIAVAGGGWTWSRLWTHTPYANSTAESLMIACRKNGVRDVMTTLWGDDGQECPFGSAIAALQFFAESAWSEKPDETRIRNNFNGVCDADYQSWVRVSEIDTMKPFVTNDRINAATTSKWLLWQDPFLALMQPQLKGKSLKKHYEKMTGFFDKEARKTKGATLLKYPAQISRVLTLKCDLAVDLRKAYSSGKKERLSEIAKITIPLLRKEVSTLWKLHRELWLSEFKPFGWEVIDVRYGGLLSRLDTAKQRIEDYLAGRIGSIPEIEEPLLPIFPDQPDGTLPAKPHYARLKTPSNER
ncbi:MAG: family 20 glycosylhydrolase [Planctomycetota bacterium]